MKKWFLFPIVILLLHNAGAQVSLPRIIRDSMILQRDEKINLWGWASPKERVKVIFNRKQYQTRTGADGKWHLQLPPTSAGGPYTMQISGSNTITLREILFGDVWFCSGQSNMVHQLNIHDVTYAKDIAEANFPQIRQFWIPTLTSLAGPKSDLPAGNWKAAVGEDVRPFSAIAYFFARDIFEKYKVPIGIINASVGGTPIEAWTSENGLKDFPSLQTRIERNKDTAWLNSLNQPNPSAPGRSAAPADAGMLASPKWSDPAHEMKGWRTINIPGFWEDQGIKDLNGIVWYRREIDIPASMAGMEARVFLGRIVDADELYINGTMVGRTTYMYPQRRYTVPAGLLKEGKNSFVIRVTNTNGKGGFVTDKPYCIFAGKDTIDLKGYWQYKVGAVFKSFRPGSGPRGINAQNEPTALYNAMVAPIIPYNIKGICWYQGESNAGKPTEYQTWLPALIHDWRRLWKKELLPFLFIQLPGFMDYNYSPEESNWALLRESQMKSLAVPNTAMVVAIDLGEWNDIHPDNKKDVGLRMALAARKIAYMENIVYSGPLYESQTIQGDKISISFTHTGSGLTTSDGEPPSGFAIAGSDKQFVWASTRIEGDKVIAWSEEIKEPKYIRYAWADNPVNPNLVNKENLPASPFRTDQ